MRVVPFFISAVVTVGLIVALNMQLPVGDGKTPRLGYFLSPQKGFWQNADAVVESFNSDLKLSGLQGNAEVYFDERLVPHVFADNENDAFFIQGYLHAKFRLWQMEFQTSAAAGRLSEIFGAGTDSNFLHIDKFFRRLGMVYAAENSLKETEADPRTKGVCDAYTAGVNAYINSLDEAHYPFEFKLLDYKPELWTNMRTALFLKYMSFDLAGYEADFEMTNAKSIFTRAQFEKLYPYGSDSLKSIIPDYIPSKNKLKGFPIPAHADSLYFNYKDSVDVAEKPIKPRKNNGSNNWAVSGAKTASGRPILCNDPHLSLNLPSLWYEMQISTPGFNAYGATFPGSPGVIIGFNDNTAFGFTNAERDVRDYYEIKFKDNSMQEYWFDHEWKKSSFRDEIIQVRGSVTDTEHIALTVFGPVMYDRNYADKLNSGKAYACHWQAHEGSNELLTFIKLDYAKNYNDYTNAIASYKCPGQNMIFASKAGDIAIKPQGLFPAKWFRQGDFIMPGFDSSYMWQGMVPDSENIILRNPPRGFISSANQYPYNTKTYPYFLGGGAFELFRGYIINRKLTPMQNITVADMQQLQNSNYNILAEMVRPVLIKYLDKNNLDENEKKYLDIFSFWNLENNPEETGPTVFKLWWKSLMTNMYSDEFAQTKLPLPEIDASSVAESLLKDSLYEFADDITTLQKETLYDVITSSFKKAVPELQKAEKENRLPWSKFKDAAVNHLLKIPVLSRLHLTSGGGDHIINAYENGSGPSWKMVVELTDETNAYGIYPGGQNGNPGSKYYDSFINDYLAGKYYKLRIMGKDEMQKQPNLLGKMTFSKSQN